jgi:predicted nucleic acid-binding protein
LRVAYVDTSCLVAIALEEPAWEETAERIQSFDRLVASNLLEAELRAALVREQVAGEAEPILAQVAWLLPPRPLAPEIGQVLVHGYVRGADLWHLACALFLRQEVPDLAFLTLDQRQAALARQLGFAT